MASPFRIWRKHQKVLLAVLCLLAMISFVVLPIAMDMMASAPVRNPVVVSTDRYGELHESDVQTLRNDRAILYAFLESLARAAMEAGGDPQGAIQVANAIGPGSEEAVVESWLLAKRAEELGIVVSDEVINEFLTDLTTRQKVEPKTVQTIMEQLGDLSEDRLFRILRQELLAMRLRDMFAYSLAGITPAQRWDYYQRLNRKLKIEVVPLPVADYLDQVPDPDEATLRAFFEEHKTRLYDPNSPEPGFREPKKIALEYFKANADAIAVSDEEIREYYEEHKDEEFVQETLPEVKETPSATPDEEKPAEAKSEAEAKDVPAEPKMPALEAPEPKPEAPKDEKPAEPKPEAKAEAKPEAEAKDVPAEPKMPAVEAPEPKPEAPKDEKPTEPKPEAEAKEVPVEKPVGTEPEEPASEGETAEKAPEQPKDDASPSEKKEEAKEPPEEKPAEEKTSSAERPSPFRLAAFQQDAETASKPAEKPEAEKPEAEKPEAEKPEAEKPEAEKTEGEQSKYVPLETVKEQIRARLAEQKAQQILGRLRDRIQRYHSELTLYNVHREDSRKQGKVKPPEKPDFRKLAEENGLGFYRTELISALEARQLDIGRSMVDGNTSFLEVAFGQLPLRRPEISQDIDGNHYLFWKTAQVEERVPEFTDEGVRERVLRAWKLVHARSLAQDEAERLAKEAQQAGKSLEELFADQPGRTVHESEPFSWMTYGALPAWLARTPPRLSRIQSAEKAPESGEPIEIVEKPGNDFMREVFRLEKDEIGVAMNQPQTVVYVVRVVDVTPAVWQAFLAEEFNRYVQVASYDQRALFEAWRESLKAQVGFKWERKPLPARGE